MSANIIDEVKYKLNKEYGKDSLAIESNAKVAILSEVNTNFTTIPSIVWKYKAKFGAVELVHGQHTDDVHFSDNLYWCGEGFDENPKEDVYWFPCLHYKLDPKYYEELGLKEKL
jgi:hypothetical protein